LSDINRSVQRDRNVIAAGTPTMKGNGLFDALMEEPATGAPTEEPATDAPTDAPETNLFSKLLHWAF